MPFLHFFDGFRTSHEMNTIELLDDDDVRRSSTTDDIAGTERAGLRPTAPVRARHGAEPRRVLPGAGRPPTVPRRGARRRRRTVRGSRSGPGGRYGLVDYDGRPTPSGYRDHGLGVGAAGEAVEELVARGERVGVADGAAVPPVPDRGVHRRAAGQRPRAIAVLDRTKEPGAVGEPLYQDVVTDAWPRRASATSK